MKHMVTQSEIIKAEARALMRHLCIPYTYAVAQVREAFALAEKLTLSPRETMEQLTLRMRREIKAAHDEWSDFKARRLRLHLGNRPSCALALN